MCYLVSKEFDKEGCFAVKTNHGKALADFVSQLQKKINGTDIQLVTISRPSAYGEYEPYEIVNDMQTFENKGFNLNRFILS